MSISSEVLAGQPISCEVIDAHTHLCPFTRGGYYQYRPGLETMIRDMDRYGVNAIVTAPHPLLGSYCELANDITAAAIKAYPGRVMGYVTFNPQYGLAEARRLLKKYCEIAGFVGLKYLAGYHGSLLSKPYAYGFALANERRLPVLCHKWRDDSPISEFRSVAETNPSLCLMIGHSGGERKYYQECVELAKDCPNVFLEISGGLVCDWWLEDIVMAAGSGRVIYGTDAINLDMRYDLGRVVFARLPEYDKRQILAGNFRNILRRSASRGASAQEKR